MKEKLKKVVSNLVFVTIIGAVGYLALTILGMVIEDVFEYICRHSSQRPVFYPALGIGFITIFATIGWLFGWAIVQKRN